MKRERERKIAFVVVVFCIIIGLFVWSFWKASRYKCPNDYDSPEEYLNSVAEWSSKIQKENPQMTTEEILEKRVQELEKHRCESSKWLNYD